jgi:undecaprenyl-diphosphatase
MSSTLLDHAVLLGIIEGLTEFLPISSTGHLILASNFLHIKDANKVFDILVQLGAVLAICVYYHKILLGFFSVKNFRKNLPIIVNLVVGTIPAIVLGVLFYKVITGRLSSIMVVGVNLLVGGVIILLVERMMPGKGAVRSIHDISIRQALVIGCYQAIALIPGVSRSGATIIGGRFCGFTHETALEFSFLLSVPAIFAASCYSIYKNYAIFTNSHNMTPIFIGATVAFIAALAVITFVIKMVRKYRFVPFGWYRIVVGLAVMWY